MWIWSVTYSVFIVNVSLHITITDAAINFVGSLKTKKDVQK